MLGALTASGTAATVRFAGSLPPGGSTPPVATAPAAIAAPNQRTGATTALVVTGAEARSRPGGRPVRYVATATSWSGEPQILLVLGSQPLGRQQWLHVLLPVRPDGSTGWVPRNDVLLSHTDIWVALDKRTRTVSVYRRGRLARRFGAVIGKPATPTPDGLAAIYERDRQPDPAGFLGPWTLPLTVFSNVLANFGGRPGRIAIHGRGGASLEDPLGSARSHGCIRVDNTDIRWLAATAPQGAPVQISG